MASSGRRGPVPAGDIPEDLVVPERGPQSVHSDSGAERRSPDSSRIYEWEETPSSSFSPLPAPPPLAPSPQRSEGDTK